VTGAAPPSYELALTDQNFKFPQLWRTSIAADHRLPLGFIGTVDFIYNRDVNGIYYINANQLQPPHNFAGPDTRPYWERLRCLEARPTSESTRRLQTIPC